MQKAGQQSTLDYVADGYWQDFLAKRPVAGGMAFEVEVRYCRLDDTLDSLQRIDTLLSNLRHNLIRAGALDESALLSDPQYRHLLLFLAFYSGRVLGSQLGIKPHWFDLFDIKSRSPALTLSRDDFYQQMALEVGEGWFFALEPIGLRLFGSIDRPFQGVQNQPIASGIYQGVINVLNELGGQNLPNDSVLKNNAGLLNQSALNQKLLKTNNKNNPAQISVNLTQTNSVSSPSFSKPVTNPPVINKTLADSHLSKSTVEAETSELLPKPIPVTPEQPIQTPVNQPIQAKPAKAAAPTPEVFVQLMRDLDNIDVPQNSGQSEYQKARKVLDQFEQHIAKQNKSRADVKFSEANLTARKKALLLLDRSAKVGNTSAMLTLAMYELLGEGLIAKKDDQQEKALALIKKAADSDSRAQRLLSRLYYQGLFVPQDLAIGKFWLEKAAENGHPDAIDVQSQWRQAEWLLTEKKQEQTSIKRYQIFIAIVVIAAILLVLFV